MAGIPKTLKSIVDFLKKQNFQLYKNPQLDDRTNSANQKVTILELLQNFPFFSNLIIFSNLDWYDFSFLDERNIFCPVKIKISTTKTADNLNCRAGIYYALTGQLQPFENNVSLKLYFEYLYQRLDQNLKQNIEPDVDYYFLIINKNNLKDIFATSLKQLHTLVPNGSNLPFQAKWDDNRVLVPKTFEEAKNFILNAFYKSLKSQANANPYFKQNF